MTKILDNNRLSNDEFEAFSPYLPPERIKKDTGRTPYSNRVLFQALLTYLANRIPKRYCKQFLGVSYDTLMQYLDECIRIETFQRLQQDSIESYHTIIGLALDHLLMDGSIVKAPNGGQDTGKNPTDRAKKGSKRSGLTDSNGIILAFAIGSANTHDTNLVIETLDNQLFPLPAGSLLTLDSGYRGVRTRDNIQAYNLKPFVCNRHQIGPHPRRHNVEISHEKINKFQSLKIRVSRLTRRYKALFQLACTIINYRAITNRIAKEFSLA